MYNYLYIQKIMQYGSQMLLGYLGNRMSNEVHEGFTLLRRTCSNARKAFWFLKSIGHIGDFLKLLRSSNYQILIDSPSKLFDIIEQFFLVNLKT
jgi:hypothetical protein